MLQRPAVILVAILALAGCSVPAREDSNQTGIGAVPEAVAALAAPNQDLATARLLPEDNCYWYEHSGPVEVTLLPLRSTGGNPICVSRKT
ncbi:hypothetical protein [Ruegeria sp. PrR005]|uniref:Lipoprotein n=1 Tax=Ruegeria sp. PrR005 TaxID=2706882 RepID=A0A6B2NN19_9RHOB|nr:hypothetical protein [Ruegeria sp. PrR005]NDW45512.1 hypothetical protein [Ruegeria sp. PrR005]